MNQNKSSVNFDDILKIASQKLDTKIENRNFFRRLVSEYTLSINEILDSIITNNADKDKAEEFYPQFAIDIINNVINVPESIKEVYVKSLVAYCTLNYLKRSKQGKHITADSEMVRMIAPLIALNAELSLDKMCKIVTDIISPKEQD